MNFKNFSEQEIQKAREYAAQNPRAMAEEALTADYYADHVTISDREKIQREKTQLADEIENGLHDHNFTIRQRMYYYLTGKSVAFLP